MSRAVPKLRKIPWEVGLFPLPTLPIIKFCFFVVSVFVSLFVCFFFSSFLFCVNEQSTEELTDIDFDITHFSAGCPFRHTDADLLRQRLSAYRVPKKGIDEVSQSVL